MVIFHKVLSEKTVKHYMPPKITLPPVDGLANLKTALAVFTVPDIPNLELGYSEAQAALSQMSVVFNVCDRNGVELGLMCKQAALVKNLLSSYWSLLNSISEQIDRMKYAASVQTFPSVATCMGSRIG